jgi:hypothetical protein
LQRLTVLRMKTRAVKKLIFPFIFPPIPQARVATDKIKKDRILMPTYNKAISPKAPSLKGPPSRSTLRKCIRTHYRGNAEGSTLRRTLGCLLASMLNIKLRRVGSGTRYTFTNRGERVLDHWMDQHAFVTWVEAKVPWEIEKKLLSSGLNLPLNADGNPSQDAVAVVCAARLKARRLADELDIVSDNGGPRRPQTKDKKH